MELKTYLARHSLSPAQFAAMIGRPPSTITRVLRHERQPGIELLRAIHDATKGAVTPNDFLPEPKRRRSA